MKKKFFLKRALRFFAIMMVPMLLLLAAMIILTRHNVEKNLHQENQQAIHAAQTNIQLVINSVLSENNYLTSVTSASLVLSRLSSGESLSYTDTIYLHSMRGMLSSITQSYGYIHSVYLYLDGSRRAVSSEKDIVNLATEEDTGWLAVYDQMEENEASCIKPRTAKSSGTETRLLTVCQRLLSKRGCVAVNIDAGQLQQMLSTLLTSQYESLYLVGSDGELLACAGENSEAIAARLTVELASGAIQGRLADSGGGWINLGGQQYLAASQEMGAPGITILSVISQRARGAGLIERITPLLLLVLADILVVIFLAYITTKQSFAQIYGVLKMFEDAESGVEVQKPSHKAKDEYDVIMNNMVSMFLNTSYLTMQLKEKQYSQENAELMALQLQINPHFLFNTLQTLDMEARQIDTGGHMSEMIRAVSDILKYSLTSPQKPVTLREELAYLKKYVEIQRYRFGDHFIVYYETEEEALDAPVFRLLLQPMLENSLLHGIRGLNRQGYIKVRLHRVRDQLDMRVIDNGIGMDAEELTALRKRINDRQSRSIGLTNLNRRLILHYGEQSALRICSQKNFGTSVSVQIPFDKMQPWKEPAVLATTQS